MSKDRSDITRLTVLGESLCLDFANTVGWHASSEPQEWISDYGQLAKWSVHAGVITEEKKNELLIQSIQFADEANQVYTEAIELREAIYRIFKDEIYKGEINREDLAVLNRWIKRSFSYLEIIKPSASYRLSFNGTKELDQMIWPIVQSAMDLLTSEDKKRVKQCEGGTCGWLFLDTSRNKSRRWCSMEDCGNRAKAKRHYNRKKHENLTKH
ncbi:CGNR zinc finger domain-containing protein [Peribacillus glennii]|nr:CGNR zinc finger domain-containing protein [Peribacillus glennii]